MSTTPPNLTKAQTLALDLLKQGEKSLHSGRFISRRGSTYMIRAATLRVLAQHGLVTLTERRDSDTGGPILYATLTEVLS
jgi:hypothetical protein